MKEHTTKKELFAMAFLLSMGGVLLAGGLGESGSDAYLSAIIAAVGIIPLLWLYCKLITLSPGSSLFDLAELGMGKILGKAATLLLVFFSLFATGMFLAHYTNFIISILMSRTPKIIIAATIMLTVAYAASRGATALAKASLVFMFLTGLLLCFSVTVSTLALDFSMFPLPPFAHGLKNVLLGSVFVTSTPYGDMLLLLPFAQRLKKGESPIKPIFQGAALGWLSLIYIFLRNAITLGEHLGEILHFKSFFAIKLLSFEGYSQHFEILIIVIYILVDIYKITILLYFASEGMKKFVGLQTKRYIILPLSMLTLAYSVFMYDNEQQIVELTSLRKLPSLFFQFVIPLLIFIFASIKLKKRGKSPLASKIAVEKAAVE